MSTNVLRNLSSQLNGVVRWIGIKKENTDETEVKEIISESKDGVYASPLLELAEEQRIEEIRLHGSSTDSPFGVRFLRNKNTESLIIGLNNLHNSDSYHSNLSLINETADNSSDESGGNSSNESVSGNLSNKPVSGNLSLINETADNSSNESLSGSVSVNSSGSNELVGNLSDASLNQLVPLTNVLYKPVGNLGLSGESLYNSFDDNEPVGNFDNAPVSNLSDEPFSGNLSNKTVVSLNNKSPNRSPNKSLDNSVDSNQGAAREDHCYYKLCFPGENTINGTMNGTINLSKDNYSEFKSGLSSQESGASYNSSEDQNTIESVVSKQNTVESFMSRQKENFERHRLDMLERDKKIRETMLVNTQKVINIFQGQQYRFINIFQGQQYSFGRQEVSEDYKRQERELYRQEQEAKYAAEAAKYGQTEESYMQQQELYTQQQEEYIKEQEARYREEQERYRERMESYREQEELYTAQLRWDSDSEEEVLYVRPVQLRNRSVEPEISTPKFKKFFEEDTQSQKSDYREPKISTPKFKKFFEEDTQSQKSCYREPEISTQKSFSSTSRSNTLNDVSSIRNTSSINSYNANGVRSMGLFQSNTLSDVSSIRNTSSINSYNANRVVKSMGLFQSLYYRLKTGVFNIHNYFCLAINSGIFSRHRNSCILITRSAAYAFGLVAASETFRTQTFPTISGICAFASVLSLYVSYLFSGMLPSTKLLDRNTKVKRQIAELQSDVKINDIMSRHCKKEFKGEIKARNSEKEEMLRKMYRIVGRCSRRDYC